MALSQIALPSWIGPGEPAGAPMLRGAQAGATIARSFTDASRMRQEQKQFEELRPVREAQARASVANAYMVERRNYDQAEGDVDYGKWYAQYGHDPVAMMNAPLPQNEYAAQRAAAAKVSASQTDVAKKYASDITEFNKRLGSLPANLRAGFFGKIKTVPSQIQWEALGEAEQTALERQRRYSENTGQLEFERKRELETIRQEALTGRTRITASSKEQIAEKAIEFARQKHGDTQAVRLLTSKIHALSNTMISPENLQRQIEDWQKELDIVGGPEDRPSLDQRTPDQQADLLSEDWVPVIHPDGREGDVPASQLEQALKEGYKRR